MSNFTYNDYIAEEYRYRKRILVIIFSQSYLKSGGDRKADKKLKDWNGIDTDVDACYLENVFKSLHYPEDADVLIQNQFDKEKVKEYIRGLGNKEECHQYDMFFFVFLTYLSSTNPDSTIYRDDRIYLNTDKCSLEEIYDEVKQIEAMRMKPKVFLIQADDVSLLKPKPIPKGPKEEAKPYKIPQDADRLVIMSDIPQKLANPQENDKNQSFLIRAFGETLLKNSRARPEDRQDLLTLTTTINNKVDAKIKELKEKFKGDKNDRTSDMQVPLVTSTLTKLARI